MLNGALFVGVPMAALLAVAFYIYTKTRAETIQGRGGAGSSRSHHAWTSSRPASSGTVRRRNTNANRRADNRDSNNQATDSHDSGFPDDDAQCEICFEDMRDVTKVQLYPCEHSEICQTCVNRLLVSNKRECPFCRRRIDGFVEMGSGVLYG